jgi:hypothetical protein
VALLVMAATSTLGITVFATPQVATAEAPQLDLVDQTFNVEADGTLAMTVTLPKGVAVSADGFTVTVTAHSSVDTRDGVAGVIAGDLPSDVDSVDLLPLQVPRPKPDQMKLSVPIEVTTRTPAALQLSKPGLYPVQVQLREGDLVLAELVTFVHRVPTDAEGPDDAMPVAMAITTEQPVVLDDNAEVVVGGETRRELTTLAGVLEASAIPLAIRIPPSVLTTLANGSADDAALALRLSNALATDDLVSAPILPLDVSAAAAAGQEPRYTQWLRDGEDALASVIDAPAQRTTAIVDEPISAAGGNVLRNLGARLFVMPTALYDDLPNTLGGFTDTTQLVQIQVAPDITVNAAVVDRLAAPALGRATSHPALTAIEQVADLLAARQQVEDQGGDPRRHGLLLGTADLGLPSITGFGPFTELLANTPGLRPTTLDELGVRTDQLLGSEGPVVVDLPPTTDGDITTRMNLSNALGLEAVSTASMLPDGDPRTGEWTRLIGVLPTSALTDDQATGIATDLRTEFQGLRSSVEVPAGFSFNLTGRNSSVPVTLKNNADIPLTVRVRMSASKLQFPGGDETVVLPPQSFHEVRIDITALSNGTTGVTLEVFTPVGDVRLAPPVPLTASINALSGVGNLLTGAALLVLFTWWVRHVRRIRRGRYAAEAANRHPAGPSDQEDLSPDAATSTLPPS